MNTLISNTCLLIHAAEIIENHAKDIHLAFATSDGSYYSVDKDIESEIRDMNNTARQLKKLTGDLVDETPL